MGRARSGRLRPATPRAAWRKCAHVGGGGVPLFGLPSPPPHSGARPYWHTPRKLNCTLGLVTTRPRGVAHGGRLRIRRGATRPAAGVTRLGHLWGSCGCSPVCALLASTGDVLLRNLQIVGFCTAAVVPISAAATNIHQGKEIDRVITQLSHNYVVHYNVLQVWRMEIQAGLNNQ